MPRRRIPKYRHYKPKDLGLVVIDGRQHYLGRYGTARVRGGVQPARPGMAGTGPPPPAEPRTGRRHARPSTS